MQPGDSPRLGTENLILTGFMGTGKTAVGQNGPQPGQGVRGHGCPHRRA